MAASRTGSTRTRNRIAVANPIKCSLINKLNKRKPHGLKKNRRNGKTSKKKSKGNFGDHDSIDNVSDISNTNTSLRPRDVNVDDGIVCEILSRLPVKSLMRFKCVSKHWNSLIRKDPYFINLHLNQSKARPRLLIAVPGQRRTYQERKRPERRAVWRKRPPPKRMTREEFSRHILRQKNRPAYRIRLHPVLFLLTGDLLFEGGELSFAVDTTRKMERTSPYRISKPLNGLICLFNRKDYCVRVCNISTREVTSWTKSSFSSNLNVAGKDRLGKCDLGFYPVTKEHKVICIWSVNHRQVCEVLTVGDGKWRRINNVLRAYDFISSDDNRASVYVNGSIYYSPVKLKSVDEEGKPKIIVAFDVGKEKFRAIGVPEFILDQIPSNNQPVDSVQLLEIDGHPALLCRITQDIARMWLFDDDYNNGYRSSTWKEITVELPFYWGHGDYGKNNGYSVRFHSVVGTDLIHLYLYKHGRSLRPDHYRWATKVSQHSYDWKKKIFAEIKINGIPSSIPYLFHVSGISTFAESLLPVQ